MRTQRTDNGRRLELVAGGNNFYLSLFGDEKRLVLIVLAGDQLGGIVNAVAEAAQRDYLDVSLRVCNTGLMSCKRASARSLHSNTKLCMLQSSIPLMLNTRRNLHGSPH